MKNIFGDDVEITGTKVEKTRDLEVVQQLDQYALNLLEDRVETMQTYVNTIEEELVTFDADYIPGIVGWWIADVDKMLKTDNLGVQQWMDQSHQGDHLFQDTTANQPLYVKDAFGDKLGGVAFDGINDFMSSARAINTPYSIWMVLQAYTPIEGSEAWASTSGTPAWIIGELVSAATASSTSGGATINGATYARNNTMLFGFGRNGAASFIQKNDQNPTVGSVTDSATTNVYIGATVGTSNWANILVAEIFLISGTLNTVNKKRLTDYLIDKYNIKN